MHHLLRQMRCHALSLSPFFSFPLFFYTTVYHFDAGSFYQLGFSICEARHQFEGMVMKLYYDH